MKFPTALLLIAAAGFGRISFAVDRFDVQVCEASPVKEKLACYEKLNLPNKCAGLAEIPAQACYRKAASLAVEEHEFRTRKYARPAFPVKLNLKGHNWSNSIVIDADCTYAARASSSAGPSYAHLSLMRMEYVTGVNLTRLVCRAGDKCAIETFETSFQERKAGGPRTNESRSGSLTVLGDYEREAEMLIEGPLKNALGYCQNVPPGSDWQQRLSKIK